MLRQRKKEEKEKEGEDEEHQEKEKREKKKSKQQNPKGIAFPLKLVGFPLSGLVGLLPVDGNTLNSIY